MFGSPSIDDRVLDLVAAWQPASAGREHEYKTALQSYLDAELNAANPQPPYTVDTARSRDKADVIVDGEVGIELKRNLSRDQADRLPTEIETLLNRYPFVIVCACGVDDVDGWRAAQDAFSGGGVFGLGGGSPVAFAEKSP